MADPSLHQFFAHHHRVKYSLPKELFNDRGKFNLENLDFTAKNPERNVEDVRQSEKFVDLEHIFPVACQMPMEANPLKQLTAQQVKFYNTEMRLRLARKKMKQSIIIMTKEWKDLEQKEKELRENFVTFNKFVQENYEKRLRASNKIEDDKRLVRQRQEEINKLAAQIENMKQITMHMENNAKKLKNFKEYLQGVVELSKEFNSINDIIDRYQSLLVARRILLGKQSNNINTLEYAKQDMMKLIEEKNFVIMGLNNQIANLQARYENANIKALESEALVTEIKNNAVKQLGEIDTVKNSIWNVYVHMTLSKKHPIKIKKENVEEQMMYINRTLTELNKVNKLIKKKSSKVSK